MSIENRFWTKVNKIEGGCWEWTGHLNHDGYGLIRIGDRSRDIKSLAHRVSYTWNLGEIPKGLHVCHRCDNRKCVNPDHLFLGKQVDNVRDMVNKGRHYLQNGGSRGSKNGNSTITEATAKEIKRLLTEGVYNMREIAADLSVSYHVVAHIKKDAWEHV